MTRDEIRTLLAHAAATTRDWAPTSVDVDVWHGLLHDLAYDDAHHALMAHARRTHHRPAPADIRTAVRQQRADRLDRAPIAIPAADPDNVPAWIADLRAGRARDAGTLPPPDRRQLQQVFRDTPPASPAAIQAARDALPRRRPHTALEPEPETRHAPPTVACCEHCGPDDKHPPHVTPCSRCDTPASSVLLDTQHPAGTP